MGHGGVGVADDVEVGSVLLRRSKGVVGGLRGDRNERRVQRREFREGCAEMTAMNGVSLSDIGVAAGAVGSAVIRRFESKGKSLAAWTPPRGDPPGAPGGVRAATLAATVGKSTARQAPPASQRTTQACPSATSVEETRSSYPLRRPGGASRRCRRRRYNSGIGASFALRSPGCGCPAGTQRLDGGSGQGTSFPRH